MVTRASNLTTVGAAVSKVMGGRLRAVEPVPVPRLVHESPNQVRERRALAEVGRVRAWAETCPAEFADARLDRLYPDQHPTAVGSWLNSDAQNLVLTGGVGPGKSHAAHAVGHEANRRGLWVVSYDAPTLAALLRPGQKTEADATSAMVAMDRCLTWDVLIIDDLGQENPSAWLAEQVYRIVNTRNGTHGSGRVLRTALPLNLDSRGVAERYGSAVLDRIEQRAMIVKFTGPSRRKPHSEW